MKKVVLLFLAVITATAVCAQKPMKSYDFFKDSKICGLICDGSMNIQLTEDPAATGVFLDLPEGSENDFSVDITEDKYVRIKFGNDFTKAFKSKITVKVTISMLQFMKLSGATSVIAKGKFMRSNDVTISLEGSSASADYLDIAAKDVKIDIAGTTCMDELTINTTDFKLSTSGAGPKITFAGGKATNGVIETTGAGRSNISMVNFPIAKLNANIGGLSVVKANVQTEAHVKVASGASFRYMGLGVVEGDGNIKPL